MSQEPDDVLIERFRQGDTEAFGELVVRYMRELYACALRYAGNHADADDLSQTAFIKAMNSIRSYRLGTNFRAWLYRILVNLCIDYVRKRQRKEEVRMVPSTPAVGDEPQSPLIGSEVNKALEHALAEVPGDQRMAFLLRTHNGKTYAEIAEMTGSNERTARWRVHSARKKLRRALSEWL